MEAVRYNGTWIGIHPKPYEPEIQTYEICWMCIHTPTTRPRDAYRAWYKDAQEKVAVLYPSFRNNKKDV